MIEKSLLISITADLGSVCVAKDSIVDGYVSQHIALARPNRKVSSARWLAYYVQSNSAREQLLGAGYGGTKIQLSLEDTKAFLVAIPSPEEQVYMSEYLDRQTERIDAVVNETSKSVELLKEKRSALISAAVTGKIDVRGLNNKEAS